MIMIRCHNYTTEDKKYVLKCFQEVFNKQDMNCEGDCVDCPLKQSCKDIASVIRFLKKEIQKDEIK